MRLSWICDIVQHFDLPTSLSATASVFAWRCGCPKQDIEGDSDDDIPELEEQVGGDDSSEVSKQSQMMPRRTRQQG